MLTLELGLSGVKPDDFKEDVWYRNLHRCTNGRTFVVKRHKGVFIAINGSGDPYIPCGFSDGEVYVPLEEGTIVKTKFKIANDGRASMEI